MAWGYRDIGRLYSGGSGLAPVLGGSYKRAH
jgi:hypothetical protein